MKTCNICHETFPIETFYRRKHNKDGYMNWCRLCHRKKNNYKKKGQRGSNAKWRQKNPDKVRAQGAVRDAVRNGKIKKPSYCEDCKTGLPAKLIQGHHHNGYENRLDVRWLCNACHGRAHVAERMGIK